LRCWINGYPGTTAIPMITDEPVLIVLAGPTAAGKTAAGIRLAEYLKTEILSADSRQFYSEMKIGTASPSGEELDRVPHHFIGHLSIHDSYNVSRFEMDAMQKLEKLFRKNRYALMVGGSGLYIHAVCQGIDELPDPDPDTREKLKHLYFESGIKVLQDKLFEVDPVYYRQVDLNNPVRLIRALEVYFSMGIPYSLLRKNKPKSRPFKILKMGLELPRDELNHRIHQRVDKMMESGLLDEVCQLLPNQHLNALNTVGYKEIFAYLEYRVSLDGAVENIKTNTRRYAKRQMTWFRRDEDIHWLHPMDFTGMLRLIHG